MAKEPQLVTILEARLNKFEKSLKDAGKIADREVSRIESRFSKMNPGAGAMTNFTKGLVSSAVAALSLERAITSIRRAVGELDDIGDVAERIGISTDALQTLKFTLGQAGGSAEIAEKALDKFADSLAEAALGGGYLAKFFEANNVALKSLPSAEAKLTKFAELVTDIEDPMTRLKVATDAFGRQAGPQFVGTLERIANEGLPALIQQAKSAGVVIDESLIAKAGKLDNEFKKMEAQIDTAFKRLAVTWGGQFLLDSLNGVAAAFKQIALNAELVGQGRFKEALGLMTRFEAAKQRMTVGHEGTQLTPDAAKDFYDAVKTPGGSTRVTVNRVKNNTVVPKAGGVESNNAFENAIEQTKKRIAVQEAENRTIDLGTAARERARLVAELETAAKKANTDAGLRNTEVTGAQRTIIDTYADAFARLAAESERANGPLRSFAREAANVNLQLQEAVVSGLQGFEDALIGVLQGTKTAAEGFKDMANSIIADLARIAIRKAITGPIAGALGLTMPGGFAEGGFTGPGGRNQPAGVVHRGEYVFSKSAVDKIGVGNLDQMHKSARGYAEGGLVQPIVPSNLNARGGSGLKLVVNNYSSEPVSQGPSGSEGGMDVRTLIIGEVSKGMSSGEFDGPMTRYRAKPRTIRR